jgi:glycosyltransferase involved in cell wall biosynthesis
VAQSVNCPGVHKPMNIAVVADTYPPLRISGAVQMRDLVRELADQGHHPYVIVPASELDVPWKIEESRGVTVLRVRTPPTKRIGYVRRTLNELRLPYVLLRGMKQSGLFHRHWDGVVWYSPTIFLGPIVRAIRRRSRCRSYLILRDIFPEWAVDMGLMRKGAAYRFFKHIEAKQYAVADSVGVQTEANIPYMEPWADRFGFSLEVLQNWLSPAPVTNCRIDVSKTRLAGRRIFVYAGNMGVAQGMDVFLEFAARMRRRSDVGFLFVGGGRDAARFAATAEQDGLDNVVFHGEIEPAEIPGLLAQCHIGIVALDIRHKSHNIPGKFLTYMQAGIPVLARINPHNDLEQIINSERVGKVCTGGGAEELVRLAEELLGEPAEIEASRERGRRLWQRMFSTKAAVDQVVAGLLTPESDRPRRVLILNQFFWPDVAATAQHAFDLARYLRRHGDRVSAIASRSIYGQAGGALPQHERVDGIEVHRVGTSLFGKGGLASRTIDFVSFNLACLVKAMALRRHDVVICLTTPPFVALIGWILKVTKGSRFIFWTMDLYPDVPLAAGVLKHGTPAHRLFDRLDRFCLAHADQVVVLGRCMRERIRAKGVPEERIRMIPPWSDPTEVLSVPARSLETSADTPSTLETSAAGVRMSTVARNAFRAAWGIGDRFVIEYSGNCGVGHDISSVCDAMLQLRDDDSMRWVFVGGGVMRPRLEEFIRLHDVRNVVMKPYQPRERLGELIALGDAHLVLIADGFEGMLLPSKFYGVMAAARPTIYVGPAGSEVDAVVSETHCGFSLRNGDGAGLVSAIRSLQRDASGAIAMGLRGRRALEEQYSMQRACEAWRSGVHEAPTERR